MRLKCSDYIQYTEELEKLEQDAERDEYEIAELEKIIADLEDVLFNKD